MGSARILSEDSVSGGVSSSKAGAQAGLTLFGAECSARQKGSAMVIANSVRAITDIELCVFCIMSSDPLVGLVYFNYYCLSTVRKKGVFDFNVENPHFRRQRQKFFAPTVLERRDCFCDVFRTFGGCIKCVIPAKAGIQYFVTPFSGCPIKSSVTSFELFILLLPRRAGHGPTLLIAKAINSKWRARPALQAVFFFGYYLT